MALQSVSSLLSGLPDNVLYESLHFNHIFFFTEKEKLLALNKFIKNDNLNCLSEKDHCISYQGTERPRSYRN